jgi:hypothetical protein
MFRSVSVSGMACRMQQKSALQPALPVPWHYVKIMLVFFGQINQNERFYETLSKNIIFIGSSDHPFPGVSPDEN